jgi:Domain of unknown function (DUF4397)
VTSPRRVRAVLLIAFLALLGAASFGGVALAAPATPAYVRLAHLSPDTPNVDVYVDSLADRSRSFVVPGVGYGAVSPYRPLSAGTYVISMRAAGAPAAAPPVISTTVDARSGDAYTIAGVGPAAALGLSVLNDKLAIPAAGTASVRVINAAVTVPSADIGPVGKPAWAQGVKFGSQTEYRDVALGQWVCEVSAAGRMLAQLPVDLKNNSVYTVLLLDKGAGLQAQLYTDSTGSAVVPVGGVETGLGGTAPPSSSALAAGTAAAAAMLVATAAALVSRVRSRRAGR